MASPKKYIHNLTNKIYFQLATVTHKSGDDDVEHILYRPENELKLYTRVKSDFDSAFRPVT